MLGERRDLTEMGVGPRGRQSGKASWRRKHLGRGRVSQSTGSKSGEVA